MTKAVVVIAGLALVLAACAERMATGARSDTELGKICTDLGVVSSTYQYDRCIEVLRHEY